MHLHPSSNRSASLLFLLEGEPLQADDLIHMDRVCWATVIPRDEDMSEVTMLIRWRWFVET